MKILVVAENGFTRSSVNVNLRSAGYEVIEAEPTCLFDVLAVMRELLPHLVIMDYEIPSCVCETVVRIIREDPFLFKTPILLVIERWEDEATERMRRWGQVNCLLKPLQVEHLLQGVHEQFPALNTGSLGASLPA